MGQTILLVSQCYDGKHAECRGYNGPADNPNFTCDCECHKKTMNTELIAKMKEKVKPGLTKKQLLAKLEKCAKSYDTEGAHCEADGLLVEFINDVDIAEAYNKVDKWYA